MRQTIKQKQNIQNKEFCKNYLTADWDGCAANDYFANLCDSSPTDKYYGKPHGEPWGSFREIAIADSNVYLSIAHLAFEKIKIVTFLQELTLDNIVVPDSINDKEKYKVTFMKTAKVILTKIVRSTYDFQKPRH